VGQPGSGTSSNGTFTVNGSGADIWGTADAFNFMYQQKNGNFQITARVATEEHTNSGAKAGVMIRETLSASSTFAATLITPGNGIEFDARTSTGASDIAPVSGVAGSAPYWLRITRSGNTFTSAVSSDGNTWTTLGSQTITMANTIYLGLCVCAHDTTQLNTSTFDNVSIVAATAPTWTDSDIGSVGQPGSGSYNSSGTFTVNGSGADIWGTADAFNYMYQQKAGDFQITARVATEENTFYGAKAGVMIRETLGASSSFAATVITPGNGIEFNARTTTGGSDIAPVTGVAGTAPYWLRITRSGSTFTSAVSSNGTTWTTLGSQTISMSTTVYAGLCVCSHDNTQLNTSTFDNVSVAP
jgi:regulation of enolase protein 1 (concanavalin A-like superfamily)